MLTRKALINLLVQLHQELTVLDLTPDRMILFGSYAKAIPHEYSDVDLAIWNKKFIGEGLIDLEWIRPILRNHRGIPSLDIKMYPAGSTSDFDPFIEEIEKTGLEWNGDTKALNKVVPSIVYQKMI